MTEAFELVIRMFLLKWGKYSGTKKKEVPLSATHSMPDSACLPAVVHMAAIKYLKCQMHTAPYC